MKTENEIMAELLESVQSKDHTLTRRNSVGSRFLNGINESIFSGNPESKDDDDDKDSDEDEKEEESDDSEDKDTDDKDTDDEDCDDGDCDDDKDEDEDSDDEDSDDDGDDDDKSDNPFGGKSNSKGPSGPFTSKIRSLQKEYNDLLMDAFEKYAPECIEDALDEADSAFGENIEELLDSALGKLKDKILNDLGIDASEDEGMGIDMMPAGAMGGFDPLSAPKTPMEISI